MRLKNVKGANEIIINGTYYVEEPSLYKGKWNSVFGNDNPIYILRLVWGREILLLKMLKDMRILIL